MPRSKNHFSLPHKKNSDQFQTSNRVKKCNTCLLFMKRKIEEAVIAKDVHEKIQDLNFWPTLIDFVYKFNANATILSVDSTV